MPVTIDGEHSRACSTFSLRGRARKVIPNAFTKQVAARAAVRASSAPAMGNNTRVSDSVGPNPASSA